MTRHIDFKRRRRFKKMIFENSMRVECHYCGKSLTRNTITLDHIIPLSKGGCGGIRNIVPACQPCNLRRGNTSYARFVERLLTEAMA